ncbi:GNAT family N-acetyltransferase [Actinocatenispora rupis]|uniref:N-acetyltransferase n=1 Tax=Actinocatenispora rupis TaxID=519421 RepID=A0A8J3J3P4_9ACTN|nr:GNAT family N-acetyltransferase [Actinocatenispora rupis]GID11357.1 N-acetyltransferase [Actinocatenispora rupis]
MTAQTAAPARFPELTVVTPRLVIRPLTADDTVGVAAVFDDRQTRRWMSLPTPYTESDAKMWCTWMAAERRTSGDGDHYGIVHRDDDRLLGVVWTKRTDWATMSTEISYAVAPDARGFGYTAEAADALAVDLILEHGFQRLELRVAAGNVASRRVAEKAGFVYEGLLRNAGTVESGRVDLSVWSLVPADLRGAS